MKNKPSGICRTVYFYYFCGIVMRKMVTILGPTASGKTALAAAFSARMDAEIISADSRQVYRRMDIGTGKDLDDYEIGGVRVPYHLIDIVEPGTKYNVFEYQRDFAIVYSDILGRGVLPVMCGGTGLYIEAVLNGYQLVPVPENKDLRARLEGLTLAELTEMLVALKRENCSKMHNKTDVDTVKRAIRAIEIELYYKEHALVERRCHPKIDSVIIGVHIDRDERRNRITERLRRRLDAGMVDEVRSLIASGVSPEDLIYYGLEYKFVTEFVIGRISYNDMFTSLETAIHQFAKRQMTWFRGMERRGRNIHWIDAMLPIEEKVSLVTDIYNKECGILDKK